MHLKVPFQDELFAVSISICVGLRCGCRAPSIIPLSAACRALCHFILSFLLIVQYILLRAMLLDRCRGFSMLTSLQNYLASIPPAHGTGPAVYVLFHAGSDWNCSDISHWTPSSRWVVTWFWRTNDHLLARIKTSQELVMGLLSLKIALLGIK